MSYDHQKSDPISPWLPKDHSLKNQTGKWANFYPKIDYNRCKFPKCVACWVFCPDSAIKVVNDKITPDLYYCKGCMICQEVCPSKAIQMRPIVK